MPRFLDWPPVWLGLAMAVVWMMAEVWAPLGAPVRWLGVATAAVALVLAGWAALTFARARTTLIPGQPPSVMVTHGPFRFSRNPIYLADLLILAGWALWLGTLAGLVLVPVLLWTLERRFILPEEAALAERFGDDFRAYADRVPRWL